MRKTIFFNKENPKVRNNKRYFRIFGTAITIVLLAVFISGCTKEKPVKDPSVVTPLVSNAIAATSPANKEDTVAINPVVAVTFNSTVAPSDVSASTLTLKEGTVPVAGKVTFSGITATFIPDADLKPETEYTAKIKTNQMGSSDDGEHSWKFKTGKDRQDNNLSIVSVAPLNKATEVALKIQPKVTFKSGMDLSKIKAMSFTLKQGTAKVAGTITYSGVTATFVPAVSLAVNTLYTATISSGVKSSDDNESGDDNNESNNHQSDNSYTWSFTTGGGTADVTAPTIISVLPANSATEVLLSAKLTVAFSEVMNASTINSTTFTLKQGTTVVAGTVAYSGTTATFTPSASLVAMTVYTGTITTGAKDAAGNALANNFTWSFTTSAGTATDVTPPTVLSVLPANNSTLAALSTVPTVTFSEAMNSTTINSTTFTLKQGTTVVAGTVAYSGTTATFTPSAPLAGGMVYTATITTGAKDLAGNAIASNYTWSFTTSVAADVTPPTVVTVVPANNATSIAINSSVTASFSEAMNSSTFTSATFTLMQGTTAVAGTVAYSGTTATFSPSAPLAGGMVYTATITTGAKDMAGNAIASNYAWSFTTAVAADVTPPTVVTVVPANSATSIAINSAVTASFSEAMNSSTITSATFTLMQGTTAVAGTVAYSGTTATFTPSAPLAGGMVYTATITTGAKDVAGNAVTTAKTWSFTTVVTAAVVSFATQVLPILQNKCMPCHGATSPSAGISITNYTTVSKMSNTQIDNPGMYSKMGVTAAEQALIKAWIAAGKLNN